MKDADAMDSVIRKIFSKFYLDFSNIYSMMTVLKLLSF